jgi:hypothetical protein
VLEYVPARQDVHVPDATAPTAVEYLPATQCVHAALPVAPLYFPETHRVHVPPSGPDDPALQMQAAKAELPAVESESVGHPRHVESAAAPTDVEYLPETQSVHVSEPGAALNFPATHCVHNPPLGPDEPALQMQAAKAELPAGASELDGHSKHVESAAAPTVVEYLPESQSVHVGTVPGAVQVPTNPAPVVLPSDVKTTFRYGWLVEDVYVLELISLPESFASSVSVLHDDDVH